METENGELKQFVELKRRYKRELANLEGELRKTLDQELAQKKKTLTEEYVSRVTAMIADMLKPLLQEVVADD
jgi:Zn-dependent M32 family carboxypeptidase